jgi:hypothetical protein
MDRRVLINKEARLRQLLAKLREGGRDPFDEVMRQAAAANIEAACATGKRLIDVAFETIINTARCPNPALREIQLEVWGKALIETARAYNEMAEMIRKELKS